ncbi:hypothetical protein ACHWQZ_G005844 [Mnemiopsis leidyi]
MEEEDIPHCSVKSSKEDTVTSLLATENPNMPPQMTVTSFEVMYELACKHANGEIQRIHGLELAKTSTSEAYFFMHMIHLELGLKEKVEKLNQSFVEMACTSLFIFWNDYELVHNTLCNIKRIAQIASDEVKVELIEKRVILAASLSVCFQGLKGRQDSVMLLDEHIKLVVLIYYHVLYNCDPYSVDFHRLLFTSFMMVVPFVVDSVKRNEPLMEGFVWILKELLIALHKNCGKGHITMTKNWLKKHGIVDLSFAYLRDKQLGVSHPQTVIQLLMVASDLSYLLFYDTFEHTEHVEESQIDMISFNTPVILHEIRVVPKGVAGHPAAPMKGETSPDTFTLDFFAKITKNKNACVFEPVGHLDYTLASIQLPCNRLGLVDSLVLYGTFSACTLAVYGTPYEDEVNNFLNKPPPSPSDSKHESQSPMEDDSSLESMSDKEDSESREDQEEKSDIDMDDIELDAKIEEARKTLQERNKVDTLYECLSPEGSPNRVSAPKPPASSKADYEELSDEELPVTEEGNKERREVHMEGGEEEEEVPAWIFVSVNYDPYSFRPAPLTYFYTPTATFYQKNAKRMSQKNQGRPWSVKAPPNVTKLTKLVQGHGSNPEVTAKWILALEQCHGLVSNFLHYVTKEDLKSMVTLLGKWVLSALSLTALSGLQPGLNVRGLKAGLMLMDALCCCSPEVVDILLKENVVHKLLRTFAEPSLGTPTRLLALKAIGSSFTSEKAVKEFVKMTLVGVGKTGYQVLSEVLLHSPTEMVGHAATVLLNRVHLYELLLSIKLSAQKCVKLSQDTKKMDESSRLLTVAYNNISQSIAVLVEHYLEQPHCLALPNTKSYSQGKVSPETSNDGFIYLLTLLEGMLTVESIALVMSIPVIRRSVNLSEDLHDLLINLLGSYNGCMFLSSRQESCYLLIRTLLDNVEPDLGVSELPSLGQLRHSGVKLSSHSLGLLLTVHLQAVQLLDRVLAVAVKEPFSDDPNMVSALSYIAALLMVPAGRAAYFTLLSSENNMTALLTFLTVQPDKTYEKQRKRSLAYRHSVQTLQTFVKSKEGIVGMIKNLQAFTNLFSKTDKESGHDPLGNVSEWMNPFVKLKMMCTRLNSILDYIKSNSETMKDESCLPRLTTSLRIVEHLVLQHRPMPHQLALQLTDCGAIDTIIQLFESTCKMLERPWMEGVLCGDIVLSVVNMIQPALDLCHSYISYLLSKNHSFTNMSIVKPLLQLHTLLFSLPPPTTIANTMSTLQHTIANILLTFTTGSSVTSDTSWTKLVQEVLNYSTSTPQAFISSLMMFCELLPQTLPIISHIELGVEEEKALLHYRHTWAAHLLPFWGDLQLHIQSLLPSCSTNVNQVLRRFLGQICDLSNQFSEEIVQLLFTAFDETPSVLQFISYLSYVGSSKAAIMDYLIVHKEVFEKILEATSSDSSSLSQHALVCLFGLCDPFVSMLDFNPGEPGISQMLVDSVPPTDMLQTIAQTLLGHLNQGSYTTITLRLRTIWTLVDHQLGQEAVRVSIQGGEYKVVLGRLCGDPSVTQEHDTCSSLLLDLLHRLTEQREKEKGMYDMAKSLLGEDGIDMLKQLSLVLGPGSDLSADIVELLSKFEDPPSDTQFDRDVTVAPIRGSGREQWDSRKICVSQPRSNFWQPPSCEEEPDSQSGHVRVDLEDLTKSTLPDYDLKEALESHLMQGGVTYIKEKKEQRVAGLGEGEHVNARDLDKRGGNHGRGRLTKTSMMRLAGGNDFVRDVFRSRKQNTSRPPSMHVDDFIEMEKHKTGPTLPPTNQIPVLQERYSNADLQHPSPLLWGRDRASHPGNYHHQHSVYYNRALPSERGNQHGGTWYQGDTNQPRQMGDTGGRHGNAWYGRDRFSGGGGGGGGGARGTRYRDYNNPQYLRQQRNFR